MMFPALTEVPQLDALVAQFLQQLPQNGFTGLIQTDYATRLINATDNSVYQVLPQAVLTPKNEQDVASIFRLAAEPVFHSLNFSPRGGGTGTNGQSLTRGIVIDVARLQNHILELNLEQGWVRIQPGVILDQLNDHLKPHGVFFAPNLSPSNRATIGGMANTDACGKGSRLYGRTSDHVLGMRIVLNDGTVLVTGRKTAEQLNAVVNQKTREAELYQTVRDVCADAPSHPGSEKLGRFITAYNLWRPLRDDGSLALDPLICGSEGTLAVVTELTLKLTPLPKHKGLFAVRYRSFDQALAAAQQLLAHEPSAIETIDDKILNLAKNDVLFPKVRPYLGVDEEFTGNAVNLVEFIATDDSALSAKTAELKKQLADDQAVISFYYSTESAPQGALWELRKKGVGLLGNTKGKRRPIPFVEDTAVPPEHLADYIREFRALLDSHGLSYGMFGHVDVGCLHVRPALNLRTDEDEQLFRKISDGVYTLLKKYGGVMWSEHGKGFRAWYGPDFHGDAIYQRMRRIKTAFDPRNQLNPGKICTPLNSDAELISPFAQWRGQRDRQIDTRAEEMAQGALYCNGNGQCFDYRMDSIMCPSYKATNDRIHSPKGRSGLMREWLTQVSAQNIDIAVKPLTGKEVLRRELRRFGGRDSNDFSHQVADAMSGCLGCKACATQCPIKVDVPAQKSLFLHHYHRRYPRPVRDYLLSSMESWAPIMARVPRLANALMFNPLSSWFAEKVFGLRQLPRFATRNLYHLKNKAERRFDLTELQKLSSEQRHNTVFLLPDAFTGFFDAHTLESAVQLLETLGKRVVLLPFLPLAKADHVKGLLPGFERKANRALSFLSLLTSLEVPVVCLETTQTLMFSQEYRELTSRYELPSILSLHEYLHGTEITVPQHAGGTVFLFSHCTEKSQQPASTAQWQSIFQRAGLELQAVATGCCGMAGSYGHEREHREQAARLWQQGWADNIAEAQRLGSVCASGFSCREQARIQQQLELSSPAELLLKHLRTGQSR